MTVAEELEYLTNSAKQYRTLSIDYLKRNKHMNDLEPTDEIPQRVIDAILTDYINFVAGKNGCDYALYASDLKKS